jgi:hypothetical protein
MSGQVPLRALAGLIVGVSAWVSLGTLGVAVVDNAASTVGFLPPLWWLIVCGSLGMLLARTASRTTIELIALTGVAFLPWLGLASPLSLMWTGPVLALIWIPVIVAVACDSTSDRFRASISRHLDRASAAFVVALVVCGALAVRTELPLSGDEPHYLVISSSILHDGDVELANDYDEERYRDFYAGSLEPRHTKYTAAGHHYPIHGLGTSVLVAPGFFAAGRAGARATILAATALGVAFLWSATRLTTGSGGAAWLTVALLVLQVPFAVQSFSIYPDPLAAAVTCFSLWMLCRVERGAQVAPWQLVMFGLVLSTLPWLHIRLSIIAAAFGIALVLLAWSRRIDVNQLASFAVFPAISVALWIGSTYVMFESPNPLSSLRHDGAFRSIPMSLAGLLTDQEFGLLPFAPGIVLGALRLWNRSLPITSVAGIGALAGTLITTASHGWWGGTNSPARFLVPVLPVLAFAAGHWWHSAAHTLRRVGLMSVAISATLLTCGAIAGGGRYLVNVPDGRHSLFAWISDTVDLGALLPSFFKSGYLPALETGIAAVWILTGLLIVSALWALGRRRTCSWALVIAGAMAWLTMALAVTMALTRRDGTSFDRSQYALLTASALPASSIGVARLRLVEPDDVVRLLSFRLPTEDTLAMVQRPQFPIGRYRLEFARSVVVPSSVTIHMGRSAEPIWEVAVRDGVSEPFALSAPLRALIVTTADYSSASDAPVRVRPLGRLQAAELLMDPAEYVRRYGSVAVYAQDRLASFDGDGFWLWAGRQTSFVVADVNGSVPPVTLWLRAGSAPVEVRFSRGDWHREISLGAHAAGAVAAPASAAIAPVVAEVSGRRAANALRVSVTPER